MMPRLAPLLAAVALAGCTPAAGFPSADEAALVVVRIQQTDGDSALVLTRYDPSTQVAETGVGADLELHTPASGQLQSETVAARIRPGSYVVSRFMRQEHWGLCFADATEAFTIAAGDVLMLGRFDALPFSEKLQADVHRLHVERLSGTSSGVYNFVEFRGVPPLSLTQNPAGTDLELAHDAVAAQLPQFGAAPRFAVLSPAKITNTGHPGIFFPRHCGEIESGDRGRD